MTLHSTYHLKIFDTATALNKAAAEFIVTIAMQAIAERGRFIISLSGGQTPKNVYALLAEPVFSGRLEWKNIFVFWGDERYVPLDDERNNAYEAKSILLDKVGIPLANVHAIPVNLSPAEAARKYEQTLNDFFGDQLPQFDLVLLGLGENGHTASLFPGTKLINGQAKGIREVYVEEEKMFRITMTAALINQARHIVFLVTGEEKAAIIAKILSNSNQGSNYPAQLIKQPDGELYWFIDHAAASLIPV
jgi:6-phosphogluconolactonase